MWFSFFISFVPSVPAAQYPPPQPTNWPHNNYLPRNNEQDTLRVRGSLLREHEDDFVTIQIWNGESKSKIVEPFGKGKELSEPFTREINHFLHYEKCQLFLTPFFIPFTSTAFPIIITALQTTLWPRGTFAHRVGRYSSNPIAFST